MDLPITKYANSRGINIAYQVFGKGDQYTIILPGWVSNVEETWKIPQFSAWLMHLSRFSQIIIFDKAGTGLSDNIDEKNLPGLGQRAEDLRTLICTLGIQKVNLIGLSAGGPLVLFFAAHHSEMVNKIILIGSYSKFLKSKNYNFGISKESNQLILNDIENNWGQPIPLNYFAQSVSRNIEYQKQWATYLRKSASPKTAKIFYEMNSLVDVRPLLSKIDSKTLIMHRRNDSLISAENSEYLHEKLKNSILFISEGVDNFQWFKTKREEIFQIQSFLMNGELLEFKDLDFLQVEDVFKLYAIKDYLEVNYRKEISITQISRLFGINEFKLKKGFRILFGSPMIRYLVSIRLSVAKNLLYDRSNSIAIISDDVGYKHPNNLTKAFKKKFGLSPQEFRSNIRS